jgi:hypothetical protein
VEGGGEWLAVLIKNPDVAGDWGAKGEQWISRAVDYCGGDPSPQLRIAGILPATIITCHPIK